MELTTIVITSAFPRDSATEPCVLNEFAATGPDGAGATKVALGLPPTVFFTEARSCVKNSRGESL